MLVSFSWILPANCLGFLFIVMRIAFLEDVICAHHIVQAVLMMSKPSDHSAFQALVPLRLMHMPRVPHEREPFYGVFAPYTRTVYVNDPDNIAGVSALLDTLLSSGRSG